jgi:hypothetical protein
MIDRPMYDEFSMTSSDINRERTPKLRQPPRHSPVVAALATTLLVSACEVTLWGPGVAPGSTGNTPGGSGGVAKVGLSDRSFSLEGKTGKTEQADVYVGTHAVAIYKTPEDVTSRIGKGTLEVTRDGTSLTVTLKDAGGGKIATSTNDLENGKDGWASINTAVGMLQVFQYYTQDRVINTWFRPGGGIEGSSGGSATNTYLFRNNVEHVGAPVPEAFGHLAGTWKGAQEANTHGKPDVTVTIASDGTVTISGKTDLSGKDATITTRWDGQDDYIIPLTTSATGDYAIMLDSTRGGGSQAEGGIKLTVPALSGLKDSPALKQVHSTLSGMEGDLTVNWPAKQ